MTHPDTPILPDDATLEEMIRYERVLIFSDMTKEERQSSFDLLKRYIMQSAFQTWLSSLMAQNDRALPDVPDGWRMGFIAWVGAGTKDGPLAGIAREFSSSTADIQASGPTPRQAVLNAIAKIGDGK